MSLLNISKVFQTQWLDFLLAMTEKEIKTRYKHTLLGFFWILLNPLLQMLVIGFIFQFFVPVSVNNYYLFLFSGLLPWNFFSLTIPKATPSIVYERSLIQKAKFPRESIILSIVLSNIFHLVVSLILLVFLLILMKIFVGISLINLISYSARLLLLIPITIWLGTFTAGLSLIFSALNIKYRDVNFAVQALMPLWFYATPIVYSVKLLPKELFPLFWFNPLVGIIESYQSVLLAEPITSFSLIFFHIFIAVLVFIVGFWYFKRESLFFDDWI